MLTLLALVGPVIHKKLICNEILEDRLHLGELLEETDLFGIPVNRNIVGNHSNILPFTLKDLNLQHPIASTSNLHGESIDKKSAISTKALHDVTLTQKRRVNHDTDVQTQGYSLFVQDGLTALPREEKAGREIFSQSQNADFKKVGRKSSILSTRDTTSPRTRNTKAVSFSSKLCTVHMFNDSVTTETRSETSESTKAAEQNEEKSQIKPEQAVQETVATNYVTDAWNVGRAYDNSYCGNFYLNPPGYKETPEWERKLMGHPKTVEEFFSHKREFREALAFCDPPEERNTDFSSKAYSFQDHYEANFSQDDWAQYHAWENYQMDYMGSQCSDNVIQKLNQTLMKNADHPHTYLPYNHQESWWTVSQEDIERANRKRGASNGQGGMHS